MRFFELFLAIIAAFTFVHAIPDGGFNFELGGKLDIKAFGHGHHPSNPASPPPAPSSPPPPPAPAPPAPAPAPAAPGPETVNRNDRQGDVVNVIVNANHN